VIAIPAGTGGRGQVRIGTEDWSARSTDERPIEVGVTVEVVSIEGVAVLVRPVDGS
jgi:membrane protein implicated in regulation of membrane protease activity